MEDHGLQQQNEEVIKLNLEKEKDELLLNTKKDQKELEAGKDAQNNKKEEIKEILVPKALATAEQFREALKTHTTIARAEKAANGGKIPEFIPANRGFGGWKERKKDEKSILRKKEDGGAADTLDLYSYRIANKLDAMETEELRTAEERRKLNQPEPAPESMGTVVQEALSWKLSWSMIDPRYFSHNVERMQTMFRQAKRLKQALLTGSQALDGLSKEKKQVLSAITNVVSILFIALENNMLEHGVAIRGKTGSKFLKTSRIQKPSMETCKKYFRQAMRELHNLEKKTNLSINELAKANEEELNTQYREGIDQLPALLESQNTEYINSGNGRFVNGLVVCLKNYRNDPPEKTAEIYKNLSGMIKNAPTDKEKKAFCSETENIFREILTWNMDEFEYQGTSDMEKPDYLKKRQKLLLVFELDNAFRFYRTIHDDPKTKSDFCSIPDALYQEATARMYALQRMHTFHETAGSLTALNTGKTVEEWYGMSYEEILEMTNTYNGENKAAVRTALGKLGMMIMGDESGSEVIYRPGKTSLNAILKKNRETAGVPDNLEQYIKEDAQKNQEKLFSITDRDEFQKAVRERVLARLGTMDPMNMFELIASWKYYSQELYVNKKFAEEHHFNQDQVSWFASEVYNTISNYLENYQGQQFIESASNYLTECNSPLVLKIRELMAQDVPADYFEPLVQRQGETAKSFAERKTNLKAQYIALQLKNTEIGQIMSEAQQIPDMFIHDEIPVAELDEDSNQVYYHATSTVGGLLFDKYQAEMSKIITDPKEKQEFNLILNYLKFENPSGFMSLKKDKVEKAFKEIDQRKTDKIEKFLLDFFR